MKTCFKCSVSKPLEAFYKHPRMAGGRLNKCADCTKKDARRHRIMNPEKVREYDNRRAAEPHRVAMRARNFQRYKQEHPERRHAHLVVGQALKKGALAKAPCAFCGASERLEAHHHDYSKPLDVTWLCSACHRRFHALEEMAAYDKRSAA